MKKYLIDETTAKIEFTQWADAMGLLIDIDKIDDEDKPEVDRFIEALRLGHLAINDEGEAVYTPQHKKTTHQEPVTFHERSGATLLAMKSKQGMARGYAMMADVTQLSPATFANMYGRDIKTCEAIFGLLMA